ncbi:MAG TPA: type II secretion system F family protein [Luteibacter sp.]|nr:type II secretion system F family protein [Luteibacter sp.]
MPLILGLTSVVLALLAVAVELWWGSAARAKRRASLLYVHQRLRRDVGAASEESGPPSESPARHLPWQGLLQRAGLAANARTLLVIVLLGVVLACLVAWRMRTAWMSLAMVAVYAILVGLWLMRRIERQKQKMTSQLPDFLDGMVRVISIGSSLPVAFQSASATTPQPLRTVLDRSLQRMRAGLDLDEAIRQSGQIYRLESLELLEAVIAMSMRFGGRTDQVLQRMSGFMRDLEHAQLELKAITSETRMSSWVIGLLPVLSGGFMMLCDPEFFQPMFTQPLGHKLLLAALGMEAIGAFLLYRLARSL